MKTRPISTGLFGGKLPPQLPGDWDELTLFCNNINSDITSSEHDRLVEHIANRLPPCPTFEEAMENLKQSTLDHRQEITQALFEQLYNHLISQLKDKLAKTLLIDKTSNTPFTGGDLNLSDHTNNMAAKIMWNYLLMIERVRNGQFKIEVGAFPPKVTIHDILDTSNLAESPLVFSLNYLSRNPFSAKFTPIESDKIPSFYRLFINLQILSSEFSQLLVNSIAKNSPFLINTAAPAFISILKSKNQIATEGLAGLLTVSMRDFIWRHLRHLQKDIQAQLTQIEPETDRLLEDKLLTNQHEAIGALIKNADALQNKINHFPSQLEHLITRLSKHTSLHSHAFKDKVIITFDTVKKNIKAFEHRLEEIKQKINIIQARQQHLGSKVNVAMTATPIPVIVSNIITEIESPQAAAPIDAIDTQTPSSPPDTSAVVADMKFPPSFWQQHGSKIVMVLTFGVIAIGVGVAIIFNWPVLLTLATATLVKMAITSASAALAVAATAGMITETTIKPIHEDNLPLSPVNTSSTCTATTAMGAKKIAAPTHNETPVDAVLDQWTTTQTGGIPASPTPGLQ